MTKKLSAREKVGRKPTLRACTFCHLKHLQCLNTRPCLNCVKRKIEHGCKDIVRKRALYLVAGTEKKPRKRSTPSEQRSGSTTSGSLRESSAGASFHDPSIAEKVSDGVSMYAPFSVQEIPPMLPLDMVQVGLQMLQMPLQADARQDVQLESQQGSTHTSLGTFHEPRDTPISTPSTTANFHSMFLNQEYMMLGDLISKPLLPSPAYSGAAPNQLVNSEFFGDLEAGDTRPYISLADGGGKLARENGFNFDLRASDEHEYVLPLLSHHIYQTVQDIYSNRIINFDYPLSYHSLTFFLKLRFSVPDKTVPPEMRARKRSNLLVILKLIASYRPTFISAHKSLFQPFDFQFLEMLFQRCLLDFENLSRLNASPMIIWRRTGEIVSMLAHLADILGLNISDVLSKRTFIIELMYDDESIVEYFRLFKSVAIGSLHLTIFTKCKLIKNSSTHAMLTSKTNARLTDVEYIEFCSVWTVKRDLFDLPMMIVGHFLPSLPNNDAAHPRISQLYIADANQPPGCSAFPFGRLEFTQIKATELAYRLHFLKQQPRGMLRLPESPDPCSRALKSGHLI